MLTLNRLIQLIIMLILLIGLFVWRTLSFEDLNQDQGKLEAILDSNSQVCDLSEPCTYQSTVGDFVLTVEEGKIVPEEWYQLTLHSQKKDWLVESAQLVSKRAFTGSIPIELKLEENENVGNLTIYKGKSKVGTCSEKNALMQLQVNLLVNGQQLPIEYRFIISN